MITEDPQVETLWERIEEFSLFEKRIEDRIQQEQKQGQPDAALLERLHEERLNLRDTLDRARRWADQNTPTDLTAA